MIKSVCFVAAVLLTMPMAGCNRDKPVRPLAPDGQAQSIQSPLIRKVDALLDKTAASPDDIQFIMSLSDVSIDSIVSYYEAHPRIAVPVEKESLDGDMIASYAQEWIECRDGYGGWIASSWFHTTACGGDGSDHFYLYPGVPNGYAYRGYLQGRSVHPGVLLTMASFGWRLSSRVYDNGNVYICVGVRMHVFGVTHDAWRNCFYLYKTN
jgi:hypothetical protein